MEHDPRALEGRADPWTIGEDGYQLWGHVHVFAPVTGAEIGRAAETLGGWGGPLTLEPSATTRLPLSFGGALDAVTSGRSYDVIACVPEIGLASPVGSLRVEENTLVRSARVLTYSSTGGMMQALAFGKLVVPRGMPGDRERSRRPPTDVRDLARWLLAPRAGWRDAPDRSRWARARASRAVCPARRRLRATRSCRKGRDRWHPGRVPGGRRRLLPHRWRRKLDRL